MILITGATGTVGREVARELLAKSVPFRVMVRRDGAADGLRARGVEIARGDFAAPDSVRAALRGVERAFLLSPSSPAQAAQEIAFVDAARAAGVRHVVKLSVLAADRAPEVVLMRWHSQVERHLADSGLAFTLLRPNSFQQNLVRSNAPTVAAEGALYASAGAAAISMVDARDIGAVAAAVLTEEGHDGRTYDITGPEAVSYGQIADRLSTLLGRAVNHVSPPDDAARAAMVAQGVPEWYADGLVALFAFYRRGGGAAVADTIERLIGRPPRTLDAYLAENASAFVGAAVTA